MINTTTSGFKLSTAAVCMYSTIIATLIDPELLKIVILSGVGSLWGVSYKADVTRKQRIGLFFLWWIIGSVISTPSCYILTTVTNMPFQTWPGFVALLGTRFLMWLLESFHNDIKDGVRSLIGFSVKKIEDKIGGEK